VTLTREWHPSPSYSSRGGAGVRLIVVHTSAGATSNPNLANFLCGSNGVSYHISVDNVSGGQSAPFCYEYVTRGNKPWANCNYNGVSITGCFCTTPEGGAGWSRDYWLSAQDRALWNMAAWVREESDYFGIPLVALSASQAQGSGRGVCQHADLGSNGCGHSDCGTGFPMDELIRRAKGGTPPPEPEPVQPLYEEDMAMQVVLGEDNKASIVIPYGVSHLRLACSQGAHVNVEWPGSTTATKTYDLTGKKRVDVPCGPGSNGQAIIYSGDAGGPISACWIQSH